MGPPNLRTMRGPNTEAWGMGAGESGRVGAGSRDGAGQTGRALEPQEGLRCEGKTGETLAKVCHLQEHRDDGIHIEPLRKKHCQLYTEN